MEKTHSDQTPDVEANLKRAEAAIGEIRQALSAAFDSSALSLLSENLEMVQQRIQILRRVAEKSRWV